MILEACPASLESSSKGSLFRTSTPGQLSRSRHWFAVSSHPVLTRVQGALGWGSCRLTGPLQHAMLAFLRDGGACVTSLLAAEVSLPPQGLCSMPGWLAWGIWGAA